MSAAAVAARRWVIPEVVQTSAMDCGPAALKSLLEGFRIPVSYGRLREACQTAVDGTSIDALEDVARRIGLDAVQRIVPDDHLFLPESRALPAIVVVRQPSGLTHFVVVWRVHRLGGPFDRGGFVQVMDPGGGRRWLSVERFLEELYHHGTPVPASAWRAYAGDPADTFLGPLQRRMRRLGFGRDPALLREALSDDSWHSLAALDATVRMVASLARSGAVDVGPQAVALTDSLGRAAVAALRRGDAPDDNPVPMRFWSTRPLDEVDADGDELVSLMGCVVLAVEALLPHAPVGGRVPQVATAGEGASDEAPALPPELAAAIGGDEAPPLRQLWQLLRAGGALPLAASAAALAVAALTALGESVLFRSLFELARLLGHGRARLWGVAAVVLFLATVVAMEFPLQLSLQRLGRQLENRLRAAFLTKIPRLGDRYFSSRPMFDMTERGHAVHQLRLLPPLAGQLLRAVAGLAFTTAGIAWVAPRLALPALAAALLSVALPLVVQAPLAELDLRYRAHGGALGRFYLDALLGITAVRTHGAERAIRREHESLMVEWARAARALLGASVALEGIEALVGLALGALLLVGPFSDAVASGSVLLLAYWALSVPALGAEVAQLARQYPDHRNVTLRLLEPLGAREDDTATAAPLAPTTPAVRLSFEDVTVRAAGRDVLQGVSLAIEPGEHVAVVGTSGAGKSTFVGLLLGWHAAASGAVRVDGEVLAGPRLAALRQQTVWVDPAVQLWNRSLLDNLRYGTARSADADFADVLDDADLRGVIERLPDGMRTPLGEGGSLVSGGEGQRVRLGRGLLREGVRLAVLDEPFRGLDRVKRRELLDRLRDRWRDVTLLCVTHDVRETLDFPRVLVVDDGRVVEDGDPRALSTTEGSRYSALLAAEDHLRDKLWADRRWRRWRMESGSIVEAPRAKGGR
ncbi:MAG: ATP-binding cassette domain-containing protein [Polyangiales bacterium]